MHEKNETAGEAQSATQRGDGDRVTDVGTRRTVQN